jgi:hypothetical protein
MGEKCARRNINNGKYWSYPSGYYNLCIKGGTTTSSQVQKKKKRSARTCSIDSFCIFVYISHKGFINAIGPTSKTNSSSNFNVRYGKWDLTLSRKLKQNKYLQCPYYRPPQSTHMQHSQVPGPSTQIYDFDMGFGQAVAYVKVFCQWANSFKMVEVWVFFVQFKIKSVKTYTLLQISNVKLFT